MKINFEAPNDEARIEIIPLIDVIFCILTFFILAALQLTRQQAISVDLPKATTGQPQVRQMQIVGLDASGQIYVDNRPVSGQQLTEELLDYRYKNPTGLMVLYAAKEAKYNTVIQVLDKMREIGGQRVALATLAAEGQSQNTPQQPNPAITPGIIPGTPTVPVTPGVQTVPGARTLPPGMQPLPQQVAPQSIPGSIPAPILPNNAPAPGVPTPPPDLNRAPQNP